MDRSTERRRLFADLTWELNRELARAFAGREEGRVYEERLREQMRAEREELLLRIAELDDGVRWA